MKKPFKNPFRHHRAKNRNKPRGYSPTQIICVSFVIVIALGTLLLSLPIASRYGRMRVIDAMFTATSATCVTGLVVRDTWTQFTVFGQAVILVLIQVGGLGLVTLTSFFALAMRRRMGFRDLRVLGESVSADGYAQAKDVLRIVVGLAALFEGIGILLLLVALCPNLGSRASGSASLPPFRPSAMQALTCLVSLGPIPPWCPMSTTTMSRPWSCL